MPAIYRSGFEAEFTKYFAMSDCNALLILSFFIQALLILSFFIQLVAALYSSGRCYVACQPRTLTAGFFITFLTKLKISRLLC